MNEIIKELVGGLIPVIIIFGGAFIYLVIKNFTNGRKWNYIDEDTSNKM